MKRNSKLLITERFSLASLAILLLLLVTALGQRPSPRAPTASQKAQLERVEKSIKDRQMELRRLVRERTQLESSLSSSGSQTLITLPAAMSEQDSLRSDRIPSAAPGTDLDADGLKDTEETSLGTDPSNPDTDGDALLDGWEVKGVNGIALQAMGASPLHKDIFVEMDFMVRSSATNGLGPNETVLRGIHNVFESAPIANPDLMPGINIHLITGNEVPYQADLNPVSNEFLRIKISNFDERRSPVFHYMIWANGYNGGTSSGVSMDIPHSDFLVTLGRWHQNNGGTDLEKIGTFVHELGHNLGLRHGGYDDMNFKPNHLSVMNYSFQMVGVQRYGLRNFDYQRFPMPRLNEPLLRESEGLGRDPYLQGYFTVFYGFNGARYEVLCDGAIDWTNSNGIDGQDISWDLNRDGQLQELKTTPNEWAQLFFRGGLIGLRTDITGLFESPSNEYKPLPFIELTEELSQSLQTSQ